MARPQKTGLDYFPLDVDFFEDDKIQLISAEFGVKAESLILRLLCKIYKEGYYYKWGADQCLLMLKSMGVVGCSKEWISEVIQGLVRRCFFDEGCFNQFSVLTSTAIQSRYIKATNERKNVELDRPFWLLSSQTAPSNGVNPPLNGVNPPINSINPPINAQSKVKKSKEENSIEYIDQSTSVDSYATSENTNLETSQIDTKTLSEQRKKVPQKKESNVDSNFIKFQKWIDDNAPDVAKFKHPFTQEDFLRLKAEFSLDVIQGLILAMYNKSAHKNYLSANLTFRGWHKRDSENKTNKSNNGGNSRCNNRDDIHPTNSTAKHPTRRSTL